jgi:pilus assembly protein CpaB
VAAGVGGFILPGNKVDVLLTTSNTGADDRTGGGATTTLLQNIAVLAVAQRLDAPNNNKVDQDEIKSVTLLVTPNQAAKLDLGMNKGLLHLALRNPEDNMDAATRPATMAELQFDQERPLAAMLTPLAELVRSFRSAKDAGPEKPQPPRINHIHTLRGTSRGAIPVSY